MEKTLYLNYKEFNKKINIKSDIDENINKDTNNKDINDIKDENANESMDTNNIKNDNEEIDIKDEQDYIDYNTNILTTKNLDHLKFTIIFQGFIKEIPLFILFRALGIESDKEILSIILFNVPEYLINKFIDVLKPSIFDAYPITSQQMALKYLMHIFNIKKIEELLFIITNNCLPLYKTNYKKALYIGYMVRNLLEVIIGYKKPSDRDSMLYKRISSSGAELATLFREWYISLKLNIETKMKQLFKNVNLNREVIFTMLDYEKLLDKGGNKNIIWDGHRIYSWT